MPDARAKTRIFRLSGVRFSQFESDRHRQSFARIHQGVLPPANHPLGSYPRIDRIVVCMPGGQSDDVDLECAPVRLLRYDDEWRAETTGISRVSSTLVQGLFTSKSDLKFDLAFPCLSKEISIRFKVLQAAVNKCIQNRGCFRSFQFFLLKAFILQVASNCWNPYSTRATFKSRIFPVSNHRLPRDAVCHCHWPHYRRSLGEFNPLTATLSRPSSSEEPKPDHQPLSNHRDAPADDLYMKIMENLLTETH